MSAQAVKDELMNIINGEINIAETVGRTLKQYEGKWLSQRFRQFEKFLCNYCSDLRRIIRGMRMKCVTIGRTSNGKSSVLNAVLNTKILPTSPSETKTCFISIEGCDRDKGNMNDGQELDIKEILRLVSDNREWKSEIESELKLFLPKSHCDILNECTEFWDCPTIGHSNEIDFLIKKNSRDADVFLLVIDGCSILDDSDTSFFSGLMNKTVRPHIIFIVNKWDKIESSGVDAIRERHKKSIKEYFVDQMSLYSNEDIEERIFFVSATNLSLEDKGGKSFDELRKKLKEEFGEKNYQKKLKEIADQSISIVNKYARFFQCLKVSIKIKKTRSLLLLQEKCSDIVDEVFTRMDKEFVDASSLSKSLGENDTTHKIEEIYRKQINCLNEKLADIFVKNSRIDVSHYELKQYLNFDELYENHFFHSQVLDKIDIIVDKYVKDQEKISGLLRGLEEKIPNREEITKQLKDLMDKIEKEGIRYRE